ncbi:MAG: DUF4286 family protein [Phycisphaerales bacterium]
MTADARGTFSYVVHASFDDPRVADEWIAWLRDGHLADVQRGGALSAEVVRLDRADAAATSVACEVRYRFASRDAFDRYLRDVAPALRAEGLAKFPPERGIRYQRTTGDVVIDRA